MESSEEEFVWTNTSKDDSDSEVEMPYDGESESGNSYKEKLQKDLFQNGELDSSTEAEEPKKSKKKHKRERSPRASPPPAPPAAGARVKREPRAPAPPAAPTPPAAGARVKREPRARGHDDEAAGEHILNMKVKEERASFVAPRDSPRKRRASSAEPEHEHAPKKKKKKRERKEEHEPSATEAPDGAASPRKKKKRKRDSERTSIGDQDLVIDKFEAEETVVEHRVKVNGHAQKDKLDHRGPGSGIEGYLSKEFIEDDDSSDDSRPGARPRGADAESPARVRTDNREGTRNISKKAEPEAFEPARRISERITFEELQSEPEPPKQARRISERITFEEPQVESELPMQERITFEESQSQSESEPERPPPRLAAPASPAREPAALLGRYLRAHAHLQPVLGAPSPGAAVTADDDVWVVRAPRGLDVRALAGATLAVDARSKLKVGGRVGWVEATPAGGEARVVLLLPAARGRGFCVRAVPVCGALQLRARPPRVRAPSVAADEEPERVPLPETRPRHPLLGAGYKQAATLAPDVRRRLAAASKRDQDAVDEPDAADDDKSERQEKKKKKKKHRERPEPEAEAELHPETEEPKPKKRKRKHSSRAEPDPREPDSPPRKKKVKKEKKDKKELRRDDAAVWDSEQGIEESLFNF